MLCFHAPTLHNKANLPPASILDIRTHVDSLLLFFHRSDLSNVQISCSLTATQVCATVIPSSPSRLISRRSGANDERNGTLILRRQASTVTVETCIYCCCCRRCRECRRGGSCDKVNGVNRVNVQKRAVRPPRC